MIKKLTMTGLTRCMVLNQSFAFYGIVGYMEIELQNY